MRVCFGVGGLEGETMQTVMGPEEAPDGGNILAGCGLGCLSQLLFLGIGIIIATYMKPSRMSALTYLSVGLTQWLAIVPLSWYYRKKWWTVLGLIFTGMIGLLLCSACASSSFR